MKRLAKWIGILVLLVIVGLAGVLGAAYLHVQGVRSTHYPIEDAALVIPTDSHSIAHGAHLFETRGCAHCHGSDGAGAEVFDAGPVARVVASNITPGSLRDKGYDSDAIGAAIRHGVRADGSPLFFMPSADWQDLSDADTAALVAYVQSLPEQPKQPGESELRPLGWVLSMLGKFPAFAATVIDHSPRQRLAPEARVSVEFGRYVAQSCTGCHGNNFAGGLELAPDTPPSSNLTPVGLGAWSEADFLRAMREGKRPDQSTLHPLMPWEAIGKMSNIELKAIWAYLKQLPPA